MKRRDVLKIMPLALTAGGLSQSAQAIVDEKEHKPLGLKYLDGITELFSRIRASQTGNLLEASHRIAETFKNGKTCYCQWETGHSYDGDIYPDRPGNTNIFTLGYIMATPPKPPENGDLFLVNVIRQPLEDPREKGIYVIGGPNPWCYDTDHPELLTESNRNLKVRMYSNIWIETYVNRYGALLWLPGETFMFGPTTAALSMITYWAMTADAVRILAREGVYVKVMGDEGDLPEKSSFVSSDDPLGAKYIDEAIKQTGQIQAEWGNIHKMAETAAECVLSGGKIWVYSRYAEALCGEANSKRGGLALINTTHSEDKGFSGTDKDIVFMGIYTPNDSIDIEMLDKFRKNGLKVFSIGPSVWNSTYPQGRAVSKESDLHIGNMCDTYGIFPIKGVKRKVCPTSGLMVNLMFWSVMAELADGIIRQTGMTPAVLSTGAMTGGAAERTRKTELARKRGF